MNKAEILTICIEEIRSGKGTFEDCIHRYPNLTQDLLALLAIATQLKPLEVTPSTEFKQRAKLNIFGETQLVSRSQLTRFKLAPARAMAFALVILLGLGMTGSGTVYASQTSLPGDVLYPVKTGMENLRISVTLGAAAKANLHLELIQRRIDEATQEMQESRTVNTKALETIKQQLDDVIKELSGMKDRETTDTILSRLATATLNQEIEIEQSLTNASEVDKTTLKEALEVTRKGNLMAQVAYANHDYLQHQPSISDASLDKGPFRIDGALIGTDGENWNMGSFIIENVHYNGKMPTTGSRVILEGLVKDDEVFITLVETIESSQKPTRLEGEFGGTNENGTVDIGGIPVTIKPDDAPKLELGKNVELQTVDDNTKLKVIDKEEEEDKGDKADTGVAINEKHETGNSTKLSGILISVNATNGTITLKSAGNQITVNIKEAKINNNGGPTLTISNLSKMIGNNVKLDGLYKTDNLFFARIVDVK
jgi:hypothetical protein